MEDSNRCRNATIHEGSDPTRRSLLRGGLSATVASLLAPLAGISGAGVLSGCSTGASGTPLLGFKSVPVSVADAVVVPEGYSVQVIAAAPYRCLPMRTP